MGIEYRIRFQADHNQLDSHIRKLQFFAEFDAPHLLYYLRFDPTAVGGMPNGWVSIDPEGLYFCDNGGSPSESALILRSVIDLALRMAERIDIEQL